MQPNRDFDPNRDAVNDGQDVDQTNTDDEAGADHDTERPAR